MTKDRQYPLLLIRQLVVADFKLRYQGSILGYLWSLLKPLGIFVILYIVFVRFLRIGADVPNFSMYLLTGVVLWNFFIEVTNNSVGSIVNYGDLIRKINFPKYVIIVAGSLSAFINLAINLVVVFVFLWFTGVELSLMAAGLPIIIAQLYLVALAAGFFLSATYVRFRDIGHIWEVIAQGLFFLTPVLYPVSMLPSGAAKLLLLNPLAQLIQDGRFLVVTNQTMTIDDLFGNSLIRLVPYGITIIGLLAAGLYFKRQSLRFAELV